MPLNHTTKYSELTDQQFLLIGKVVIEFSNLDFLLGVMLTRLLLTSEFLGRTYTDHISSFKLIEAIENALDIHERRYNNQLISQNKSKEIKDILGKVKSLRKLRNKFAHYVWVRSSDEEMFGTKFSGIIPKYDRKKQQHLDDSIVLKLVELQKAYEKAYQLVDDITILNSSLPFLEESVKLFDLLKKK